MKMKIKKMKNYKTYKKKWELKMNTVHICEYTSKIFTTLQINSQKLNSKSLCSWFICTGVNSVSSFIFKLQPKAINKRLEKRSLWLTYRFFVFDLNVPQFTRKRQETLLRDYRRGHLVSSQSAYSFTIFFQKCSPLVFPPFILLR